MDQGQLGWESEAEIRARAEAEAAAQETVDTTIGEVIDAAPKAPETAVTMRTQPVSAVMQRHAAPVVAQELFDQDMQIAKALAASGVFPNAKDAGRAYAALLIGRDLGMGPAEALMSVEFGAQGKPVISVHWQAAQIRRNGHDYQIVTQSSTECMIHFFRRGAGKVGRVGMTMSDAKKIAIYDKEQKGNGGQQATLGNKWNYRTWGEDMLYAYCMRRGMRRFYPELLMGYGGSDADDVPEVEFEDADGEAEPVGAQQAADNLFGGERPDVSGQ